MTLKELECVALETGMPKFAGSQLANWLYVNRVTSIDEMTNLKKESRLKLGEKYYVGRESPARRVVSKDGTVKYLFATRNGRGVESVMIPDKDRVTLCVSSQSGCRMDCKFCMTGQSGFFGNLSSAEIMNQILSIDESGELTNIVFMGMGEPLDNIDSVLKSIDILTAKWGMGWSPKRITVSTVGKIKELKRLLDETKVHIALSVHEPIPASRQIIMPVEKAYPMADVIDVVRRYDFSRQRRFSVEYIMWDGVNDSLRHADALARLIKGTNGRVNLIRYHVTPGFKGMPSSKEKMERFRDRLNALGMTATIRASRGEDIDAACGMLSSKSGN